ncbi:hypothetical protein ACH5RR_002764 [Cinchona calisaya]|uniref:Uncharacterized protein n=1 Tax=Cinchona calisaya TaxID=153742 RepID=A0ABD3AT78_9GENT
MAKGKEAKQIVLNDKFWNNSLILVRIMGPLIRLLRVCDADEKPSMGYVYEGMQREIESIRKLFKYKDRLCRPYIDIINFRWDKMLRKNLHSASYFLNPAFQYDPTYVGIKEVTNGLLDYIETYLDWCDHAKFTHEIAMFREREGSFGQKLALNTSRIDRPEFWVVKEEPAGGSLIRLNLKNYLWMMMLNVPIFNKLKVLDDDLYMMLALTGRLDPSLLHLKQLRFLDLSLNDFNGIPIPSFIGSLKSLRYRNLSYAGFHGIIPHRLGNVSNLRTLSMRGEFSDYLQVNNFQWLTRLLNLRHSVMSAVDLNKVSNNGLQVINMIPSLVEVCFSGCRLGHISHHLIQSNFSSLAILDLSRNKLSPLPRWIFGLSISLF